MTQQTNTNQNQAQATEPFTTAHPAKISFTYDSKLISSAEIIAPGINSNQPDLSIQALRQGMSMSETKDCIEAVTGGKTEFSADMADAFLIGAAELLKERRAHKQFVAKTQDSKTEKRLNDYTEKDINDLHANFWANR